MTQEIYDQRVQFIRKAVNKLLLQYGAFTAPWRQLPDDVLDGFWQHGFDTYAALFYPIGPPMEDLLVVLWIRQERFVDEDEGIAFYMDTYDRGEYLLEKNSHLGLLEREEKRLYGPIDGDECVVACTLAADGRFEPEGDRLPLPKAVATLIEDDLMMRIEERHSYWDEYFS